QKKQSNLANQEERENFLIGMMRVNMMKRLESSAYAFNLTLGRTIEKMEKIIEQIDLYEKKKDEYLSLTDATTPDNDEEDDDFIVGKRKEYKLKDLKTEEWKKDLQNDLSLLQEIHSQSSQIDEQRDAKLQCLRKVLEGIIQSPRKDKYDRRVRNKGLVFTAFADTAKYLYKNLESWAEEKQVNMALVIGTGENKSKMGSNSFQEILTNFAPIARGRDSENESNDEIDILIATDCISEGQNLQDCPVVINYDIHWNPVRLMQRFGRIDRIGSRHKNIQMVNFWPTEDLNRYLNLTSRVEARMALMDATATGEDDILNLREESKQEITFRDRQMKSLRDSGVDGLEDNEGLSDFTLDDFLVELLSYLEKNRKALENSPYGLYAVTHSDKSSDLIKPGVIFCLRQHDGNQGDHPTNPYFLTYVREDGNVRYTYDAQAKHILGMFGELCRDKNKPNKSLCEMFDKETVNGKEMRHYSNLLKGATENIRKNFLRQGIKRLKTMGRDGTIPKKSEIPDEFELVTWLVIKEK
ncbi:MAG: helicase-related protein, partial [Candidatus Dadabacteria bacterium]|nr:helicase-related protein [Candidatus Dadabacteria bacterium]